MTVRVSIRQVSADLTKFNVKTYRELIMCVYTEGRRSRRGSPKAGTNVCQ